MAITIHIDQTSWYGLWDGTAFLLGRQSLPHPDWLSTPAVDRAKVKIKRLDYFGHSGPNDLFMQYGLENEKGILPGGENWVSKDELDSHLTPDIFTSDSFAHLWGCHLGEGLAPILAKYIKRVRACRGATNYDPILDRFNRYAMPAPVDPTNFPWEDFTVQ